MRVDINRESDRVFIREEDNETAEVKAILTIQQAKSLAIELLMKFVWNDY